MKSKLYCKILAIGIIVLFVSIGINPAFAVDTKQSMVNEASEEDCGCNEVDDRQLVVLEKQLTRLEMYSKFLLVLSRYNPELKKISEELLNEITIVNNKLNGNFSYCLLLLIRIAISVYLFSFFDLMHNEFPEDSILYKIFLYLCHYYINKFSQLIDSGKDYDCWWWEPDPHP